jgi:hypothetical protein
MSSLQGDAVDASVEVSTAAKITPSAESNVTSDDAAAEQPVPPSAAPPAQPEPQSTPEPAPEQEPEPEPQAEAEPPKCEPEPEPHPELQPPILTPAAGNVPGGSTLLDTSIETAAISPTPAPVGFTVPTAAAAAVELPDTQLSRMLAQFQQLQALPAQAREEMLAELPPEVGAAARVAVKLPKEAVDNLASAAVTMQKGEAPPPEAIGTAFTVFSQARKRPFHLLY